MAIKNGRMLYKYPGTLLDHYGKKFDYLVVERDEADAHVALGWSLTVEDALVKASAPAPEPEEAPDDDAPPTRAELEEQCKKLGIKVDGRYSDKRLLALIAEKMG